jgi:hypothetical protein
MSKSIERLVKVTISEAELLNFFVASLKPDARASEGQERTFYHALSHLVGISDVEAVKRANKQARSEGLPTITVAKFRKWLPQVFSQFAAFALYSD